jgi:hypothetical protein
MNFLGAFLEPDDLPEPLFMSVSTHQPAGSHGVYVAGSDHLVTVPFEKWAHSLRF